MKKGFSLFAGFFVFAAIFMLSGCKTTTQSDIWSMLRTGDLRAMDYFLGEINVDATDSDGKTPLHYAAETGNAQLAGFLLSIGANPDILDYSRTSPLWISVENEDPSVSALIVSAGADIHLPVRNNTTAAVLALEKSEALFKSILTPASVDSYDNNERSILHLASIAGNLQAVNDILPIIPVSGGYLNLKDNSGKTALDYAFERIDSKSHMDIAEQLILTGAFSENPIFEFFAPAVRSANFNIRRNDGMAPIHHAVINGYTGLIEFLFRKNADINLKSSSGATALHEAVRKGDLSIIELLIRNGADVNSVDGKGNSPLHLGIPSQVHKEVIDLLIAHNADPNLRDEYGDTPLHIAVILNRSVPVIQSLLSGGADVHIRNIQGKTPLYLAVQEGRTSLIGPLVSYDSEIFAADNSGVSPFSLAVNSSEAILNALITPATINQRDSYGNTMLHLAVANYGTPQVIGRILDSRALVDTRNREGDTALHIAVRTNQRESGEFLISRGANIFSSNSDGRSPLYIAFTANNGSIDWILNPTTIIAKDGLGNNILHYTAQWGLDNIIPQVINSGIPVNSQNSNGETPLFTAVRNDSPSTIITLVENRAALNMRDTQGNSVLHAAVRWNALRSVQLLISLGIDVDIHSLNGNTPLHDAVTLGISDMETLLISSGANLEVRNTDGNTPFMEAVRSGQVSSIQRLAGSGADISTRNSRGDTPLHIAVSMERIDIVNFLLSRGVSIHARNTRNRTPFQIALSVSPEMVTTLLTAQRINTPDDMGNSPLHIGLQERVPFNIFRTILSTGTRINAVDSNGKTPLRIAVDLNLFEHAKLLSDAGADPFIAAVDNKTPAEISFEKGEDCIRALFSGRGINARDSSENTILHIAARFGNPQSIAVLLELGANLTIKNIANEVPYDIALRWNRRDNADVLRTPIGY